ncbi:hypothetical protein BDR04DRAFT_1114745 [Suillus decipiens]|nr:hypothetical protein BDR04DRAFT_1114745 [Suillus decipiens]
MLACQQLAWVLADAYSNSTLDKCSNGRVAKHEEGLLQKISHQSELWLEKPLVILDLAGHTILWYLPNAISPWIQAKVEEATIGIGSLLKKSMTSGTDTQWRTFPRNFHTSNHHRLTPGCINLAPCWFQQGQEPHGFPLADGFTPEVSATLKGKYIPDVIIWANRVEFLMPSYWPVHLILSYGPTKLNT